MSSIHQLWGNTNPETGKPNTVQTPCARGPHPHPACVTGMLSTLTDESERTGHGAFVLYTKWKSDEIIKNLSLLLRKYVHFLGLTNRRWRNSTWIVLFGGDVNVPRLVPSLLLSCRLPLALNGRSGFVHGTQRSRWYRQLHQATSEPPLRKRKRLKLISCGHLKVQMSGNAPLLSET